MIAQPDNTPERFPKCWEDVLLGQSCYDAVCVARCMRKQVLGLREIHQQFWAKPHFSDLAEDALLVRAAEERIVGAKDPHQHVLRLKAAV